MLTLYKIVFNRDHNWPSMCTLHACQWIHSVMRKNTYESSKDTWEWIPLEWMYKCNVLVCCPNVDYPIIICSQLQSMWRNYVCTLTCCGWSLSSLLLCRCILWNRCRSEHVNAEVYIQKTYYVKQKLTKLLMLHPVCYFVYPLHKMQYNPLPRQHNVMRVLLKSLLYGNVA